MAAGGCPVNLRETTGMLKLAGRYIARDRRPLLLGMVITERCNLACHYCRSHTDPSVHFTFTHAQHVLREAYERGHRALYFTGGEPMLWRDGRATLRDVVDFARGLGFCYFMIYTNGTLPFSVPASTYIVTLDGPRAVHERIRPGTYDRIVQNVRDANREDIYASMTICRQNFHAVRDYVQEVSAMKLFRGIWFNVFTGTPLQREKFGLTDEQRTMALEEIWKCRSEGYPVMLSKPAYHAWRANDWPRPLSQTEICTPGGFWQCCRDVATPGVCEQCGYAACIELSQVFAGKLSSLFQAYKSA
jgi:MoaA/NifB/PqqE/SkfB family radical SAM enzyme